MIWRRIIEQPAAREIPSGQSSHAAWDRVSCRGDAGGADRRESSQRDAGKVLERAELVPAQVLNEQISAEIDAVLLSLLVLDRLCWPVVFLSFGLHCPAVLAVASVCRVCRGGQVGSREGIWDSRSRERSLRSLRRLRAASWGRRAMPVGEWPGDPGASTNRPAAARRCRLSLTHLESQPAPIHRAGEFNGCCSQSRRALLATAELVKVVSWASRLQQMRSSLVSIVPSNGRRGSSLGSRFTAMIPEPDGTSRTWRRARHARHARRKRHIIIIVVHAAKWTAHVVTARHGTRCSHCK